MSDIYHASIAALTPEAIASMSREEAGAALDRLTNEYRGVQPIAEVMKATPTDAVGAHKKLAALQDNPQWRDLYFAGNAGARKDFETLTTIIASGSDVDFAVSGVRPEHHINTNAGASLADMTSAAADMRVRGLTRSGVAEWLAREGITVPAGTDPSETVIYGILSDKVPNRAEHEIGVAEQKRLMGDKDFQELLNAGDPWARCHLLLTSWRAGCYIPGTP